MKACAHHDVAISEPIEEPVEIRRIVLAICINLHNGRVTTTLGVQESGAHRATYANVERQSDHRCAGIGRVLTGVIGGSVVDYEYIRLRAVLLDFGHDIRDRLLLIPSGDRDEFTCIDHAVTLSDQLRFEGRSTGECLAIT